MGQSYFIDLVIIKTEIQLLVNIQVPHDRK